MPWNPASRMLWVSFPWGIIATFLRNLLTLSLGQKALAVHRLAKLITEDEHHVETMYHIALQNLRRPSVRGSLHGTSCTTVITMQSLVFARQKLLLTQVICRLGRKPLASLCPKSRSDMCRHWDRPAGCCPCLPELRWPENQKDVRTTDTLLRSLSFTLHYPSCVVDEVSISSCEVFIEMKHYCEH